MKEAQLSSLKREGGTSARGGAKAKPTEQPPRDEVLAAKAFEALNRFICTHATGRYCELKSLKETLSIWVIGECIDYLCDRGDSNQAEILFDKLDREMQMQDERERERDSTEDHVDMVKSLR